MAQVHLHSRHCRTSRTQQLLLGMFCPASQHPHLFVRPDGCGTTGTQLLSLPASERGAPENRVLFYARSPHCHNVALGGDRLTMGPHL